MKSYESRENLNFVRNWLLGDRLRLDKWNYPAVSLSKEMEGIDLSIQETGDDRTNGKFLMLPVFVVVPWTQV
jgi:hypothetical protein